MNENITKTTAETENNTNETTQAAPPRLTLDVTPETRLYVSQINDLMLKVTTSEKDDTHKPEDVPDWERLRYVLFQLAFKEAIDGIKQCEFILNDMDEKYITEMCDREGITVNKAYKNAHMNMVLSIIPAPLRNLLSNI